MVSHVSGYNKTILRRVGAPKHNAMTRLVCFNKKCRGVIGWKQTQQRNKFKGYKKGPGVLRLKLQMSDSLKNEGQGPLPTVPDTTTIGSTAIVAQNPPANDQSMRVVFNEVLFETNSSTLNEAFAVRLDSLTGFIVGHDNYTIRIVGHTDHSGTEERNTSLSYERAEAVAQYLVLNGVKDESITFEGMGSKEPIDDNNTPEGRQKNRRVEIFLSFP
jgi:outer membrane protein OmpA-like peptidoglycan-associated protein